MYDKLKAYCKRKVPFTDEELKLIDTYFEVKDLKKKDFLLQDENVCKFIAFITKGAIRHFHIKNGLERTCDISFEESWVTDFHSFIRETPCVMNLQAMEDTQVLLIKKENLHKLYSECNKYETFGRLMAEDVAQRATTIAMSLSSDKPEERVRKLIENQSSLFLRIPQKYIANFLGISPESLSRIRSRMLEKQKS